MTRNLHQIFAAVSGIILLFSGDAFALKLDFACLTHNNAANCAIGEAQLSVTIEAMGDPDNDGTKFTFLNFDSEMTDRINPVITEIYFDSPLLTGYRNRPNKKVKLVQTSNQQIVSPFYVLDIQNSGVNFGFGMPKPPNLPGGGGRNCDPDEHSIFCSDFGIDLKGGGPRAKGIGEMGSDGLGDDSLGEWLMVKFKKIPYHSLLNALQNEQLDIGLHVVRFPTKAKNRLFSPIPPWSFPFPQPFGYSARQC